MSTLGNVVAVSAIAAALGFSAGFLVGFIWPLPTDARQFRERARFARGFGSSVGALFAASALIVSTTIEIVRSAGHG